MALTNNLSVYGIILIFLGIILIIASSFSSANVKSAGIIFIGPFPFGYASDKTTFYILLILTILALIIFYVLKR